jgi:YggT family protein
MQFIAFYTDPYLNLFRRIIPPLGMFDLSPIVAFLCLSVVEHAVKALLFSLIS